MMTMMKAKRRNLCRKAQNIRDAPERRITMKRIVALLLVSLMFAGCAAASPSSESDASAPSSAQTSVSASDAESSSSDATARTPESSEPQSQSTSQEAAAPSEPAEAEPNMEAAAQTETESPLEEPPTQEAASQPPVESTVSMTTGAIPFNLAAGTGKWWYIDSTDSAYWAVQDNINAMRAAGGLSALTMDDSLSAAASARCESFVLGGAFDHSGMTTRSEICARGPIGSASAVCEAWRNSPDHYANIMCAEITAMGVSCWFCDMDGNQYTYWTVTFG